MLIEGLVGVVALIAASAMHPGDYFAINTSADDVRQPRHPGGRTCPALESAVGETVAGRPGGAVSLAVGIAQIFTGLPGMRGLMDYWYHFAIMFEALFILTTIDTGTRVARFLVQEFLGQFYKPMARQEWMPGAIISTLLVVVSAGPTSSGPAASARSGRCSASPTSCSPRSRSRSATTIIINTGKARYAWVTRRAAGVRRRSRP